MKVTLPDTAVDTLKDILKDNQDRPSNIRVYFAGVGWGGPSVGLALDEQDEKDLTFDVNGLHFVMDKNEYEQYGDITIEDSGYGFRVTPEKGIDTTDGGGCGGCTGC